MAKSLLARARHFEENVRPNLTRPPTLLEHRVLEAWHGGRMTDTQLEAILGPSIWKKPPALKGKDAG